MKQLKNTIVYEEIIYSETDWRDLPIVASVWFGALGVFVITSILSAFCDLMFVCMQRFNRSRIMKIVEKQ